MKMEWYVELNYANGEAEKMYCTSREEARERRRYYLHNCDPKADNPIIKATVRRVP